MECKLLQVEKAASPIEVTDDGIVTCSRDWQLEKAMEPIDVTDSGIIT